MVLVDCVGRIDYYTLEWVNTTPNNNTTNFKFLVQYREALQQRRQEAVATAAIEALTKDSILHRRDVKTLVKAHKDNVQNKDRLDRVNNTNSKTDKIKVLSVVWVTTSAFTEMFSPYKHGNWIKMGYKLLKYIKIACILISF